MGKIGLLRTDTPGSGNRFIHVHVGGVMFVAQSIENDHVESRQ